MPAAGKQARRPAGAKKCRIHADTVFADCQKTSQSFAAHGETKCESILSGGVYGGQNSLRDASVEFVRRMRTNYARRITQPFQTRTKPPRFAFESLSKRLFDKLKMPHPCGCGIWEYRLSGTRFRLRQALPRGEPSRNPARTAEDTSRWR